VGSGGGESGEGAVTSGLTSAALVTQMSEDAEMRRCGAAGIGLGVGRCGSKQFTPHNALTHVVRKCAARRQ